MNIKRCIVAFFMAVCLFVGIIPPVDAAWDGYAEKNAAIDEEEVVLVDMNNLNIIFSAGAVPQERIARSAKYSARWNNHPTMKTLGFTNVPRDWSSFGTIKFDVYSETVVNSAMTMIVDTDFVPAPGKTMSYFSTPIEFDWTGWKTFEIELSAFKVNNQSDWTKVNRLRFASGGWGNTPNEKTDLYFDNIYATIAEEGEVIGFTKTLSVTKKEEQLFKDAMSNAVAAFNFSERVYAGDELKRIESKLTTSEGLAMAPISFFKDILGAEIADNKITLGNKTANLNEPQFSKLIFEKDNIRFVPLVECAQALGKAAKTFNQLTVIGSENHIKHFEDDESLADIGGIIIASKAVDPKGVTKQDWEAIKISWRRYLVGDENNNLESEEVATAIKRIDQNARSVRESMNRQQDAAVLFGTTPVTTTAHMTSQYTRLEKMVLAYGTYGSSLYKDRQLKRDIMYGLEWLYQNLYGQAEIENRGWRNTSLTNWWDWYCGVAYPLCSMLMILEPEMKYDDISKYLSPYDHFRTIMRTSEEQAASRTYTGTASAVLHEDADRMLAMVNDFNYMLDFQEKGNGTRSDFTYITHVHFPYNSGYGVSSLLDRISRVQAILAGTVFEFATPYKYNSCLWFYEMFEPVMYKAGAMAAFGGRYPADEAGHAGYVVALALDYIGSFGLDDDERLKTIIRRHVTDETMSYVLARLTVNEINTLLDVMGEDYPQPDAYERTKVYYQGDRVVQQRDNYAFTLSMSSSRIANYESIHGKNITGWYSADGMLYMYTDNDLQQYRNAFWSNANPYRMPGTTVDTQERQAVSITINKSYKSNQDFVGAVEFEDKYSVAAMQLESFHNDVEPPSLSATVSGSPPLHNSTLMAKKAWFMFDDEVVALGTDINANDGFDVLTVVENRKLVKNSIKEGESNANEYPVVSVTANGDDGNVVENIIDNDYGTRWSMEGDAYAIFELEDIKEIGYVGIAQYGGINGKQAIFEIDVSTDGDNWTTVFEGKASGETALLEAYDMKNVKARYVRYNGHGRTNSGWNSVTEFKIYAPTKDGSFILDSGGGIIPGVDNVIIDGNMLEKKEHHRNSYTDPSWAHIENVGGYYFPQGGKLELEKTNKEPSFLEMWFEHGKSPKNGSYSYVLLPHKTSEETAGYAKDPNISILSNTAKLQAVKENTINALGIVFWEAGNFDSITVSEPLIVMVQETDGEYAISFCDPTQKLQSAQIKINKKLTLAQADKNLQVNLSGNTVTINADLSNAKGKTYKAKFTK